MKRLLLTGAAGGIGAVLRTKLAPMAETLRISDIADLGEAASNEEIVYCDLSKEDEVLSLVDGCDGIVHFGGISVEKSWSLIRPANIEGVYNVYEAARKTGCRRILFASSNHAVGFYKQTDYIDDKALPRPDGIYGVSKVFGEAMASMYHDKFGIETAIVRIGSCFPEPINHRMMATWMSYDDFTALIDRIFKIPRLGCPIIYGISNNDRTWWDNSGTAYIGWHPKDNGQSFEAALDKAMPRPRPDAPDAVYQGGYFTADPIFTPEDD